MLFRLFVILALLALPLQQVVAQAQTQAQTQAETHAWAKLQADSLDVARKAVDAAVDTVPGKTDARLWYTRGLIYKALYDADEEGIRYRGEYLDLVAFDSYTRAIELDYNHLLAAGILEDVYSLTEDFARVGLDLFERGYDSRNTFMLAQAARYLDAVSNGMAMLGPKQLPIHTTLRAYGIDGNTLEVCRALAKDKSGNNDHAKTLYEELVRKKTQEPAVYLGLREIYANERQRGKALRILEQGRQNVPTSPEITLAFAEQLADTNRSTDGLNLARGIARSYPRDAAPFVSLGFIEEKRKNATKAEAYYVQAIENEHTDFMANFRLGKLYFKWAEESRAKRADAPTIKALQEKSLACAQLAAATNPKHFGNNRILLELYTALGYEDKAQLLRTEMN